MYVRRRKKFCTIKELATSQFSMQIPVLPKDARLCLFFPIVDLLSPVGEDAVDTLSLAVVLRFHLQHNQAAL